MLLGPIYALYADGWWRAVSRRLLLKATAQQIHPLPSVIRHTASTTAPSTSSGIFYVCSTLHSEQSQNDLGHAHLLLFGIGIALRGMQAEAHCTLHVARCSLRVAAALIYCLLLPWLWFAIFSRISMATWPGSAPPESRNPESPMPMPS